MEKRFITGLGHSQHAVQKLWSTCLCLMKRDRLKENADELDILMRN